MNTPAALQRFLDESAHARPDHTAVEEAATGAIAYRDLAILSDRLRDRLRHDGVRHGDRVGVYMSKSIDAVASIFGILKAGAAYVPVDPNAPAARNKYILNDCSVRALIMESRFAAGLDAERRWSGDGPYLVLLNEVGGGLSLAEALDRAEEEDPAPIAEAATPQPDDLALILYTSGTTGKPKGVMLSHRSATSFVNWCSEAFQPDENDRFSSHAPFHFDLSVLDLYVSIKHRATLVLIGDELGKSPLLLAPLIADKKISSWYSTPSILSLLAQYGKLDRHDYSALRTVLFAGEVFPVKHLRALKALLPEPTYYNLYGPTETNVCTFFEVPTRVPEDRDRPFPIGKACSHYRAKVVDEQGREVDAGEEGELCVSGPGVMQGYWNLQDETASAFLEDGDHERWYKTGDIVVEEAGGDYLFVGRRDRMVKKRGYRIELGEIESGLYRHSAVKNAAVVALPDEEAGLRIKAFLTISGAERPSIIELKRFCAENLPDYMIPDLFSIQDALPMTSTDKIDYQALRGM